MTQGYALDFWPVLQRWPALLDGVWLSLLLTVAGMVGGTGLGIFGALGRTSRMAWLRWLLRAYVELFRNTPLLVRLFLVYLGLPSFGIRLSPVAAAFAAVAAIYFLLCLPVTLLTERLERQRPTPAHP